MYYQNYYDCYRPYCPASCGDFGFLPLMAIACCLRSCCGRPCCRSCCGTCYCGNCCSCSPSYPCGPFPPSPSPPPQSDYASASEPTVQTVRGGSSFALGSLTSQSGIGIEFDPTLSRFLVRNAGTYEISYAFDYLAGETGTFAIEVQGFGDSKAVVAVDPTLSGKVAQTATLTLPANTYLKLYFPTVHEAATTLDALQVSALTVTVKRVD